MKDNLKIYIKGNSSRGWDVIHELTKRGASNPCDHFGDVSFNYYYIDNNKNIRAVEDVDLLKGSGYVETELPPPYNIVPFSSSEEIQRACHEHGNMVRNRCGISLFEISRIISLINLYHSEEEVYRHLVNFYKFEDGTPCGVVVEKRL